MKAGLSNIIIYGLFIGIINGEDLANKIRMGYTQWEPVWHVGHIERDHGIDMSKALDGKRVLARDSQVDGSVFVHSDICQARQAGCERDGRVQIMTINFEGSESIMRLFNETKASADFALGQVERDASQTQKELIVAYVVFEKVLNTFKHYDEFEEFKKTQDDAGLGSGLIYEIPLDYFVKKQTGVCRHAAPLAGVMLEQFKKQGYIGGDVSCDASIRSDQSLHIWCRYTMSDKTVVIIDTIYGPNFGKLEELDGKPDAWNYKRPAEQLKASGSSGFSGVKRSN